MQPTIAPTWLRVSLVAAAIAATVGTDAFAQRGLPPPVITPPPVVPPPVTVPGIPSTPVPCETSTPGVPPVVTTPPVSQPPVLPPIQPPHGRGGYAAPGTYPYTPGPGIVSASDNYAAPSYIVPKAAAGSGYGAPSYMVPGSSLGSANRNALGAMPGSTSRARSMLPQNVAAIPRPALELPYRTLPPPTPTAPSPPTVTPCTPPPTGSEPPIIVVTGPGSPPLIPRVKPPVIMPPNRAPEPGTLALLLAALGGLVMVRRRPSAFR